MDNFFLRLVTVDSHFRLSLVIDHRHLRYFFKGKKQKLQKTESTVGKRVENEERLATMFTHATQGDTFVLSSFVTYLKGMSEMFSERSDSSPFI
jgi:hypothetical protein